MACPIEEDEVFHLALIMQKDPNEIRQWDIYDISRLMMFHIAQTEARETKAMRLKVPAYKVSPITY